jgi:N-acetylglucosaminyldiphosphoundecaprenol N-acetyl-beta-D-mannosaminyltransferase
MSIVFGLNFTPLTIDELVASITQFPIKPSTGPHMVFTANTDHIVQLYENPDFRASYDHAWVITADGMPVFLYAKLRGAPIRSRLTGADLCGMLIPALQPDHHRCFFVASSLVIADRLRALLLRRGFAQSALAFEVPPFGFEHDMDYSDQIAERIHNHKTTHLFLGLGAPKSEVWAYTHRNLIGDCYVLCVGMGLEYCVGARRRAPVWMRHCGCEWLWRFGQEPRRLFYRYFIRSGRFFSAILGDLMASHQPAVAGVSLSVQARVGVEDGHASDT